MKHKSDSIHIVGCKEAVVPKVKKVIKTGKSHKNHTKVKIILLYLPLTKVFVCAILRKHLNLVGFHNCVGFSHNKNWCKYFHPTYIIGLMET